ncbi:TetR/AcrR family transcriptional regulator [Streptomyces sp. ODS28]|uniref:TetR/AcrR family transcriptional regulator n=1 Tax=Streptomyces sp. ODS28 TaxID=3136688 RepID=UPI0031E543BA
MSQTRAIRTRSRIAQTAAVEFARCGYAGTSLTRICTGAEVTIGALTFHFSSKMDLADAVCARGKDTTRAAIAQAVAGAELSLQAIVDVTHVIALLLRDNECVSAASRLCREDPAAQHDWYNIWLPTVRGLAAQAQKMGELRSGTTPDGLSVLAACLVSGVESTALQAAAGEQDERPVHELLSGMWEGVLRGIAAPELDGRVRPESRGAESGQDPRRAAANAPPRPAGSGGRG